MVYKWYFSCQLGDGLCHLYTTFYGNQKQRPCASESPASVVFFITGKRPYLRYKVLQQIKRICLGENHGSHKNPSSVSVCVCVSVSVCVCVFVFLLFGQFCLNVLLLRVTENQKTTYWRVTFFTVCIYIYVCVYIYRYYICIYLYTSISL